MESKSVSRILFPGREGRGGDHSSSPNVTVRVERPTRRLSAPRGRDSDGQPLFSLPIWSCTARSLPGHACHQTCRCALTAPFHPSPAAPFGARWLVCSLLHLSSPGVYWPRPLEAARSSPDALPLAGSPPCSVRTFLPRRPKTPAATARLALHLQGRLNYSKPSLNTYRPVKLHQPAPPDTARHVPRR